MNVASMRDRLERRGQRRRNDHIRPAPDVILPAASGRDIARQLVAMRPSVRVLYMSGYTDDVIVQHGVLEPGLASFRSHLLVTRWRDEFAK